jgi:hypothetical protein
VYWLVACFGATFTVMQMARSVVSVAVVVVHAPVLGSTVVKTTELTIEPT